MMICLKKVNTLIQRNDEKSEVCEDLIDKVKECLTRNTDCDLGTTIPNPLHTVGINAALSAILSFRRAMIKEKIEDMKLRELYLQQ